MWRMLTGRAQDLEVRLAEHDADAERGSAHWLADYTFSTGRRVHNDIRAEFRFEDGLIAEHRDSFSFYAWARQALGPAAWPSAGRRCCARRCGARPARAWTSSWELRSGPLEKGRRRASDREQPREVDAPKQVA